MGALNLWTRRLSPAGRYLWARRISRTAPWITPAKWRAVESNLSVINAWGTSRFTSPQVFENFAATLSDFLSGAPIAVRVEGREKAEEARQKGRGVIFLTSHLGHWELGGKILTDWGWPVTAIYKPYRSAAMQRFIQNRRAPGLRYLAVGKGAAAGVGQVLHRRESVVFLGDRPFGEEGSRVSLFGRPARLPRGPFLFACRYGAPIVPGFVVRDGPALYRGVVEDPLWPDGAGSDAVDDLLARVARVLEKYIARYADQWFCFEPVWNEE